jgi:hypothetical protein
MTLPTRASLDAARIQSARLRRQMIAAQEELDWRCYRLYGLLPAGSDEADFEHPTPPEVALGERAFEIVLARRVAAGQESTTWFERHASTPITEIPDHWPEDYRGVVQRRIALIESDRNIGLIERPEYKRRWNSPSWESLEQAALRDWLLARLESPRYWADQLAEQLPQITSTSRLADALQHDAEFMHIAGCTPATPTSALPSSLPNWWRRKRFPSCRYCAIPRPACASAPNGKKPGPCSVAKTPARIWPAASARFPCRPSTRARTS